MIPRARKTHVAGMRGDSLLVRLEAAPVDGAANDALIAFLATTFGVPRRAVGIISGERGRQKRVAIAGVTAAHVKSLL